jgi:hypothetical protein
MTRAIRALTAAAALSLAACAPAPIGMDAPRTVRGLVIAPFETHEACLHAKAGERVDYTFEASDPVDFDIHYRDGNTIVMPIVRERSRSDAGVFAARLEEDYCLMWEAGPIGAFLDYQVALRPAAP